MVEVIPYYYFGLENLGEKLRRSKSGLPFRVFFFSETTFATVASSAPSLSEAFGVRALEGRRSRSHLIWTT